MKRTHENGMTQTMGHRATPDPVFARAHVWVWHILPILPILPKRTATT